jgi:hypothetical protein
MDRITLCAAHHSKMRDTHHNCCLQWGPFNRSYGFGGKSPHSPSLDHIASTLDLVAGSMRSISVQGLVKPSAAHFLVASMLLLLP